MNQSIPEQPTDPMEQFRTGLPPTDIDVSADLVEAFTPTPDATAAPVDPLAEESTVEHPETGEKFKDYASMTEAHPELLDGAALDPEVPLPARTPVETETSGES